MENLKELFDRVHELNECEIIAVDKVVALSSGRALHSLKPLLDQFLPVPDRRRGSQTLVDLKSFVDWTNLGKLAESVLFCNPDRKAPGLVAIIDYHLPSAADAAKGDVATSGRDGLARWGEFKGVYPFAISPRWKAWADIEGKPLSMVEFAAFLEDHALDLCAPVTDDSGKADTPADVVSFVNLTGGKLGLPADIMQLAAGLEVNVSGAGAERIKLQSGERAIKFEETHETRQGGNLVVVPSVFLIAVPVFDLSAELYRLPVRIRYRLDGGRVVWGLQRWRADETFDAAVRKMADDAAAGTKLPLFYGSK